MGAGERRTECLPQALPSVGPNEAHWRRYFMLCLVVKHAALLSKSFRLVFLIIVTSVKITRLKFVCGHEQTKHASHFD